MQLQVTQAIRDALGTLKDVPDNLRACLDGMTTSGAGWTLRLSDDDATALAELVQWHIRTDPATGRPTGETAPFAELIRLIDAAQL